MAFVESAMNMRDQSTPLLMQLVTGCYNELRAKPVINHERGIGSPCSNCEHCDGLDLHFWRKTCKNCGCKYEHHKIEDPLHDAIVYNLFRMKDDDIMEVKTDDENSILQHPYVREFSEHLTSKYQSMEISIDGKKVTSRKRSGGSTDEEIKRHQQLLRQIPPQDFEPRYCHELSEDEINEFYLYIKLVQTAAIGKGSSNLYTSSKPCQCENCKQDIVKGEKYIECDRLPYKWHHQCFACVQCNEQLVDQIFFKNNNSIYCGRHFGEIYKERCASCDELIFSGEYTQAEGRGWHEKHFCCYKCDGILCNAQYVYHDEHPICMQCNSKHYSVSCETCNKTIVEGTARITYHMKSYHTCGECFRCCRCTQPINNEEFVGNEGKIFCSFVCAEH